MVRGGRRRHARLALLLVPAAAAAGHWEPLERGEAHGPPLSLDRSGIGGLSEPGSLARQLLKTTVSRNHVLVASVAMGSPPQRLRCLLDSGSSDLWLPSRRCEHCGSASSFDAGRSSTFAPALVKTPEGQKPRLVKMTYGTGQILGVAARDSVSFGSWHVSNQSFIIVEDAALPLHLSWDGICGLAWGDLAVAGRPLYQRLQEQGRPALIALVPRQLGSGSHIVLGELPTASTEPGTLAWAPAEPLNIRGARGAAGPGAHRSFWVTSGGVAIGGEETKHVRFLVDTGTNQVLLVPPKEFEAFLRALLPIEILQQKCGVDTAAGGLFICDCSVRERAMPPLKVVLGGRTFALPMAEMFRRVTAKDGGEDLCLLEVQPNRMASPALPASLKDLMNNLFKPELLGHGCCSWDNMHCGSTTPYCRSSQAHCEEHCKGKWLFMDALPFQLPSNAKEVSEVVTVNPDGSVCKTWKVLGMDGQVIKQETRCTPPGQGQGPAAARRLQLPGALPRRGAGAGSKELRSLVDDLWVLGGVFLERFITVFDFDKGRMGFAEPLHLPMSLSMAQTGLNAVGAAGGGRPSPVAMLTVATAAPTLVAVSVLAAVLAAAWLLSLHACSARRQMQLGVCRRAMVEKRGHLRRREADERASEGHLGLAPAE